MQVYKARWYGTLVAVKVLISEEPEEVEAFKHEAAVLEQLRHLHIVSYYGQICGEDGMVTFSCPCGVPSFSC